MPGQARGRGKGKGRKPSKRSNKDRVPGITGTVYHGGTRLPSEVRGDSLVTVRVANATIVASSGGGTLFESYSNDPSIYLDWSAWNQLYLEYRVLATTLRFVPYDVGFDSNAASAVPLQRAMVMWISRGPSALSAPVNLAAAYDNDGAIVHNMGKEFSRTVRMNGIGDAAFGSVFTPSASWFLNVFSNTLTPSTTYGTVFTDALVQFRNRA